MVYCVVRRLFLPWLHTSAFEVVEPTNQTNEAVKEWWQRTGQFERMRSDVVPQLDASAVPTSEMDAVAKSTHESDMPAKSLVELPAWLTDQPTSQNIPVVQPPAFSNPETSALSPRTSIPAEWQSASEITDDLSPQWSEISQQLPVYES